MGAIITIASIWKFFVLKQQNILSRYYYNLYNCYIDPIFLRVGIYLFLFLRVFSSRKFNYSFRSCTSQLIFINLCFNACLKLGKCGLLYISQGSSVCDTGKETLNWFIFKVLPFMLTV